MEKQSVQALGCLSPPCVCVSTCVLAAVTWLGVYVGICQVLWGCALHIEFVSAQDKFSSWDNKVLIDGLILMFRCSIGLLWMCSYKHIVCMLLSADFNPQPRLNWKLHASVLTHLFKNMLLQARKKTAHGGWLGDFASSADALPHWGNSLRNVHYSSGLICAVGGALAESLLQIVCMFFHWYTAEEMSLRQERQGFGRRGGCWAGFHLALFMSQDKASRVREKLHAKRGGSSLVWLMYDKRS